MSAGIPPRTSVTTTAVRRGPATLQTTTTTRVAATVRTTPAVAASILSAVNRDPTAPANPAAEAALTSLAERLRNSPAMSTGINLPGGTARNRHAESPARSQFPTTASPTRAQFPTATSPTRAQFSATSPTHASFPAAPSFTHLLTHPPATFTPYTIPYHPPIPPNSQILLLQDPSGRPHSLLVGPPAAPSSTPPSLLTQSLLFERELAALQHRVAALTPVAPIAPRIAARRQIPVIRVRASHLWLALKLAVMVAIFSNGATWARTLYLSTIGLIIFGTPSPTSPAVSRTLLTTSIAWQTGLAATYLRPLAALLTAAPPRPAQGPQGEPDPEAIARMIVRRREQEGFRGMLRGVERGVALFIASLVPGLHERHVQAVEREEREARGEGAATEGAAAGDGAEGAHAQEGEATNGTDGAEERGPEQEHEQVEEHVELDEAALRAW